MALKARSALKRVPRKCLEENIITSLRSYSVQGCKRKRKEGSHVHKEHRRPQPNRRGSPRGAWLRRPFPRGVGLRKTAARVPSCLHMITLYQPSSISVRIGRYIARSCQIIREGNMLRRAPDARNLRRIPRVSWAVSKTSPANEAELETVNRFCGLVL